MLSDQFIKQVQQCDTLFTDIDTVGDCQLSFSEFEAYVQKRNPDKQDQENVMKDFNKMDIDQSGYLSFHEFLRAICKKNGVYMPSKLSIHDKL